MVEQRSMYLLDFKGNTFIDLSVTCCSAGLHVNRHRLSFPHHLGDFTEELAGLLLTAGNN